MAVNVMDDCEFTVLIADFIKTLAGHDKFLVRIWISGSEIAYSYTHKDDFLFLQEGLRVGTGEYIDYLYYDTIQSMRVYDENKRLVN